MVKFDRTNLLALWLWWYKSCENICENYTSIRTDLCPRFLTLHLKYAVLPMDALTLDCNPLRSIEGGSTFCKVDEGTMKAEPATIDGNSSGEVKGASWEWSETQKKLYHSSYFLTLCDFLFIAFSIHMNFWMEVCQGYHNFFVHFFQTFLSTFRLLEWKNTVFFGLIFLLSCIKCNVLPHAIIDNKDHQKTLIFPILENEWWKTCLETAIQGKLLLSWGLWKFRTT